MAHPIEHNSRIIPGHGSILGRYRYRNGWGDTTVTECDGSKAWSSFTAGSLLAVVGEVSGRDGSHHTTKSGRWRPPTPYWGYRFANGGYGNPTRQILRLSNDDYPDYVTQEEVDYPFPVYTPFPEGVTLSSYRPFSQSLQTLALTGALADLGSSTYEAGVELVEARKTAEYLTKRCKDLTNAFRDVRNGRAPRGWKKVKIPASLSSAETAARKRLTDVGNLWLEYRYAVTPLILGVNDALSLLAQATAKPILISARKSAESEISNLHTSGAEAPVTGLHVLWEQDYKEKRKAYAVVTAQARDDLWVRFNDAGILNPAGVWWETIPGSFMADWFVNVSDFINARMGLLLFHVKGCSVTHRHEWTVTKSYQLDPSAGWTKCFGPLPCTAEAGGAAFQRVVLSPEEVDTNLGLSISNGLNLERAADAIAIAWNLFSGGRKR